MLLTIFQDVSHVTCECVILFFSSMMVLWYFTKLCYSQSLRKQVISQCVILFFSFIIPLWYFTKLCYLQSFRKQVISQCAILFFLLLYHYDALLNCVTHNLSACKSCHMWMCNFITFFYDTMWYLNKLCYSKSFRM